MTKIRDFINSHASLFTVLGLLVVYYFIFFHNNWAYMLMDVDESRYVSMSQDMWKTKDFLTLYINSEYFFEKPPLYFWGECLSFALFGKITEATARFPVALYGMMASLLTYFLGKKIVSRAYGVVSSLILATSLEYVILSKFAILDIVVSSLIWFSLVFGVLTLYVKEANKKYCWWLFYAFSGLAVMAKGIPGFVIPFGSLFFIYIYSRKFKELFKPQYLLVGTLIFLAIVLPWHIVMLKMHGSLFFDEYIMKHHIARFLGSDEIGRQQPFYFYILTILWGFIPWIISCIAVLVRKIAQKDVRISNLNEVQKFIMYNTIIAVFILLFLSSSKTKLITYILPIYPALACIGGYIWTNYIYKGSYSKVINKTVYALGGLFVVAGIVALFTQYFLPVQLNADISAVKPILIPLLIISGASSIFFAKTEKYIGVFFTYVIFVACLSAFGTEKIFKVDYKFGQDDLIKMSDYADENHKSITCLGFDRKYSLLFYGEGKVKYILQYDKNILENELKKPENVIILKKKDLNDEYKNLSYKVILEGRKYLLISN